MKSCLQCPCGVPAAKYRRQCNRCRMRDRALAARVNLCECGCGSLVARRFEHGHQTRLFSRQEQSRRAKMNDGSTQRDRGSGKSYRKLRGRHEHRRVVEEMFGRPLRSTEIVHHKNGDKRDNRRANLQVMTRAEHIREHQIWRQALRART
jgi:HNH endonuclease